MSSVIHISAPSVLTQAHRDAMAYIQELATTISMQGVYCVSAEYAGVSHELRTSVLLFSEIAKDNFKAHTTLNVYLPGRERWAGDNALEELQAMARVLEGFLIPPSGDAA